MKRALVTGASGFLGRHLQVSLRNSGVEIATAGRASVGDIARSESWQAVLRETKPEVIFHLMGSTSGRDKAAFDAAHVEPTRALLQAALELDLHDVPIFVIGSAAEYGNVPAIDQPISEDEVARPVSNYGRGKLRATEVAREYAELGMHAVVVRLFNLFGEGMSSKLMPGPVLAQLQAGAQEVQTGPLDRVRDFLHVGVAMDALTRLASAAPEKGAILNLCSGHGLHLREIAEVMIRASGLKAKLVETGDDSPFSGGVRSCVGNPERMSKLLGSRPAAPGSEDFARLVTARSTPDI